MPTQTSINMHKPTFTCTNPLVPALAYTAKHKPPSP